VDAVAGRLHGVDVRADTTVLAVGRRGDGYVLSVRGSDGETSTVLAGSVVLAVPARWAAGMVEGLDPSLAVAMRGTPYTSTVTVTLGFRSGDVPRRLPGHGYLVPVGEGRLARACT
jgi:oxygen-dependent protoporphyrinogen oxidase